MMDKLLKVCVGLGVVASIAATPAAAKAQALNGAGATFPDPIYEKWFDAYAKKTGVKVNYQAIGSGGGITNFTGNTVDFAASDAPMNQDQMNAVQGKVLHIPTVIGAVVMIANLPSLGATQIKLDGPTIADIYLGKINKWTDPRLAALNPGVKFPSKDIIVVHRADGSGTSYIFTDFLSKNSAEWKGKVGTGTAPQWPTGLGGAKNDGVTQQVKQVEGAIGYVELIYALQQKMPFALVKNPAGTFVNASLESASAAAATAKFPPTTDFRVSITNAPGTDAYPICSFTWLLIRPDTKDAAKAKAIKNFLTWIITPEAQNMAKALDFAPLPGPVTTLIQSRLGTLTSGGKPIAP